MSQAKVDKYKEEKKNREKQIKKKRTQKIAAVMVGALLLGGLIGYPVGKKMYSVSAAKRKASATIKSEAVDLWMQEQWQANYSDLWIPVPTGTDAEFDPGENIDYDMLNGLDDATGSDAK